MHHFHKNHYNNYVPLLFGQIKIDNLKEDEISLVVKYLIRVFKNNLHKYHNDNYNKIDDLW